MVKPGNYKITYSYPGGYNSLDPEYGNVFTGYRVGPEQLGLSLDPRTANIIKDFSDKLASGQKTVELSMVMPEVVDTIPKQQLEEVRQLSKLTGVDVTVHGPLLEASGLSKEGFSESNREAVERQMLQAVGRAHQASPEGNVPVTFHSSAMIPATEYGKDEKGGERVVRTYAIERESGNIMPLKEEEKYYPHLDKKGVIEKKMHSPKETIEIINDTKWADSLTEMILPIERTNQVIKEVYPQVKPILQEAEKNPDILNHLSEADKVAYQRYFNSYDQLSDVQKHLGGLFDKAYKYSDSEQRAALKKIAQRFDERIYVKKDGQKYLVQDPLALSQAVTQLRSELGPFRPELFQSVDEYSKTKTSQTFGNVAYESYKKFKNNAPIISIENPPAGMNAFSRGKDLAEISDLARQQFVKRAMKGGMNKSRAEKEAEKLIGVTWDVGHINQIKKYGFDDKDLEEESKRVKPYLKHVHLSDNFGMENTELPMGAGNVPLKKMMDALGVEGEKAKKIVEAGNWWQHFQVNPMSFSYEAMGSPIYSMKMAPYWNQAPALQAGYFSGYGPTLPQINYETFGGGFSQLPQELGGTRQQTGRGRMSGTPME